MRPVIEAEAAAEAEARATPLPPLDVAAPAPGALAIIPSATVGDVIPLGVPTEAPPCGGAECWRTPDGRTWVHKGPRAPCAVYPVYPGVPDPPTRDDQGLAEFVRWAQEGPLRKGAPRTFEPLDAPAPAPGDAATAGWIPCGYCGGAGATGGGVGPQRPGHEMIGMAVCHGCGGRGRHALPPALDAPAAGSPDTRTDGGNEEGAR